MKNKIKHKTKSDKMKDITIRLVQTVQKISDEYNTSVTVQDMLLSIFTVACSVGIKYNLTQEEIVNIFDDVLLYVQKENVISNTN